MVRSAGAVPSVGSAPCSYSRLLPGERRDLTQGHDGAVVYDVSSEQ